MPGSSESWGLNSTQTYGTLVPVEEPSTASMAEETALAQIEAFSIIKIGIRSISKRSPVSQIDFNPAAIDF
jgi:hypothetical protein